MARTGQSFQGAEQRSRISLVLSAKPTTHPCAASLAGHKRFYEGVKVDSIKEFAALNCIEHRAEIPGMLPGQLHVIF